MLIMATEGMAYWGSPRKAIVCRPSPLSATLTMPMLGSSSHSQSKPTTTGGISQGRINMARTIMDLVSRDIITAITIARMVCSGMFSIT